MLTANCCFLGYTAPLLLKSLGLARIGTRAPGNRTAVGLRAKDCYSSTAPPACPHEDFTSFTRPGTDSVVHRCGIRASGPRADSDGHAHRADQSRFPGRETLAP